MKLLISHQQEIGLKIYQKLPCPSELDPISPSVNLSHQEASISLLSFSIRGWQNESHKNRKLTKLITWTTALSSSMKLWAMMCRATQDGWVMSEFWLNAVYWKQKWQTTAVFLPWEPHEQYEKTKRWDTERWTRQVPSMLLESSGEMTPERRDKAKANNNTQLWM